MVWGFEGLASVDFGVLGFRVYGFGILGFRVYGLQFWSLGFRV